MIDAHSLLHHACVTSYDNIVEELQGCEVSMRLKEVGVVKDSLELIRV